MLLIVIIPLMMRMTLPLMTPSASDQNLATSLLLQSFLVDTLWPNQKANVINPSLFRKIDFRFELLVVRN